MTVELTGCVLIMGLACSCSAEHNAISTANPHKRGTDKKPGRRNEFIKKGG